MRIEDRFQYIYEKPEGSVFTTALEFFALALALVFVIGFFLLGEG